MGIAPPFGLDSKPGALPWSVLANTAGSFILPSVGSSTLIAQRKPSLTSSSSKSAKRSVTGQVRTCTKCGKTFNSFNGLKYHMSIHTGHFKFWCEICQKGLNKKDEYERHMKKHR